jgi:hypothetical protein
MRFITISDNEKVSVDMIEAYERSRRQGSEAVLHLNIQGRGTRTLYGKDAEAALAILKASPR